MKINNKNFVSELLSVFDFSQLNGYPNYQHGKETAHIEIKCWKKITSSESNTFHLPLS